jgi:hypothetical protein
MIPRFTKRGRSGAEAEDGVDADGMSGQLDVWENCSTLTATIHWNKFLSAAHVVRWTAVGPCRR